MDSDKLEKEIKQLEDERNDLNEKSEKLEKERDDMNTKITKLQKDECENYKTGEGKTRKEGTRYRTVLAIKKRAYTFG